MSFAPLPAPGSAASSSIWARRMITKSVPTTDAEVELNVLSLLLDVPLTSLDEQDLIGSPVSMHSAHSPWSSAAAPGWHHIDSMAEARSTTHLRSTSAARSMPGIHRSRSLDSAWFDDGYSLEMHAAQTAVKAALDVLEEPSLNRGLRISTAPSQCAAGAGANSLRLGGCLSAPLSPALSSPTSPAESCFSGTECDGTKKKGRARMSQEKRKRLARRREREALVAALTQQPLAQHGDYAGGAAGAGQVSYLGDSHLASAACNSHLSYSAPVTRMHSYFAASASRDRAAICGGFPFDSSASDAFAVSTPLSSPRSCTMGFAASELASPALTHASVATTGSAFGSIGTRASSPVSVAAGGSERSSSPPTLVVQPPSPQRLRATNLVARIKQSNAAQWNSFVPPSNLASVY